jgi:hypothetical protein
MNTTMIAIIVVLVIAVGLVFILKKPTELITPPTTTIPTTAPTTIPPTITEDELILSDQINALTDEQLAAVSIDLTDFSTTTQNDIASDNSLFMYQ